MITPSFNLTATERVLPRLALDFTTASLDSRITFTRSGATATCVNSAGYVAAVSADTARFDYSPVTLACKGLLIEESRTNLALYSAQFSDATWSKANSSVDQDLIVSPDGTQNADFLKENSATSTHFVNQFPTLADNTSYAVSCYGKKGTRNWLVLGIVDKAAASKLAYFDLNAGVLGNVSSGVTSSITDAGNGWYRCVANVNSSAGATPPQLRVMLASANGTFSYTGDGTSGLYIWGAQLEAGAFATSYIPTTSAALTRNADVATMTGTNFSDWFNASEGTFVVSGQKGGSTFTPFYTAHDGTNNNKIETDFDAAAHLVVVSGGVTQANIDAGTVSANTLTKLAAAYKVNSFAACISGGSVATDTSGTIPTVDRLQIGGAFNAIPYGTKTIATLSYYPMRLTNAEVQAFSK